LEEKENGVLKVKGTDAGKKLSRYYEQTAEKLPDKMSNGTPTKEYVYYCKSYGSENTKFSLEYKQDGLAYTFENIKLREYVLLVAETINGDKIQTTTLIDGTEVEYCFVIVELKPAIHSLKYDYPVDFSDADLRTKYKNFIKGEFKLPERADTSDLVGIDPALIIPDGILRDGCVPIAIGSKPKEVQGKTSFKTEMFDKDKPNW
jgi:hypothetical protein